MSTINETHSRTTVKAIVYRIISFIVAAGLTLSFGGTTEQAFKYGVTSIVLGLALYYVFDRVWVKINWARSTTGDESKKRSVVKAILYRICAMIIIFISARAIWADTTLVALMMTGAQFAINICTYFIQDRVWNGVTWGKIVK